MCNINENAYAAGCSGAQEVVGAKSSWKKTLPGGNLGWGNEFERILLAECCFFRSFLLSPSFHEEKQKILKIAPFAA